MTPTPRTDARIKEILDLAGVSDDKAQVKLINTAAPWMFARELERELAEAKAALDSLNTQLQINNEQPKSRP